MRLIAGSISILILATAGSAWAQDRPIATQSSERLLYQASDEHPSAQAGDEETVEVANPFLKRAEVVQPDKAPGVTSDAGPGQMALGAYKRPNFAEAPIPAFIERGQGAVGLAFHMKLGG